MHSPPPSRFPGGAAASRKRPAVLATGLKVRSGPPDARLLGEFTYSVIETSHKIGPVEKRRGERLRTRLRAGSLLDKRNKPIVDCLIQDRSRSGARIRLALNRPLPRVFLLADEISQSRVWVQLAWQNGRDAGVRLMAP